MDVTKLLIFNVKESYSEDFYHNSPWGWGGGGGVSESMDRWGCAILVLEVVPKNLIFT